MFDTMTITKIVAGFCSALLIFLLVNWGANALYGFGGHQGGEGEHAEDAYPIEVADAGDHGGDDGAEEGDGFAEAFAAADAAKGEKVFSKCKACHKLADGANGVGPHLFGLVGRAIGGVDGYGYSSALAGHGDSWTPENLNAFLASPKAFAPGTKMTFTGLKKVQDRANIIAYLQTVGN